MRSNSNSSWDQHGHLVLPTSRPAARACTMAEPPDSNRQHQHQHYNHHHLNQHPNRDQQHLQRHEQQLSSRLLQHQPILKGGRKRKLVWTREDQAGATAVASSSGDMPAVVHAQPQPVPPSAAASGAAGRLDSGKPALKRQKAVQLDVLESFRAQVAAKEAQVQQARARIAIGNGDVAGTLEAEAQQRNERRQKLEAGFAAALAESARLGVDAAAAGTLVQPADAAQVTRVLQAKTDYEVLQVRGAARL